MVVVDVVSHTYHFLRDTPPTIIVTFLHILCGALLSYVLFPILCFFKSSHRIAFRGQFEAGQNSSFAFTSTNDGEQNFTCCLLSLARPPYSLMLIYTGICFKCLPAKSQTLLMSSLTHILCCWLLVQIDLLKA